MSGETTLARSGRLAVALIGGYAFTAGLVAMIGAGLPHWGMERVEAATLGAILGLPAYLVIIIWVASSVRPWRTALVIAVAALTMILLAPMLAGGGVSR